MPPIVDVVIADARWMALEPEAMAARCGAEMFAALGIDPDGCEIALLACDDARIAALNAQFRGRAEATNVLSWPSAERGAAADGATPAAPPPGELGDIAIAWETCAREAAAQGKTLHAHVTHLVVHGMLHLLGFDHMRDRDATLMEACEVEILARLGVADPYMTAEA